MCVPQPPPVNYSPQPVPAMQAATNLQLGGDAGNRTAAQLGRLMLRLGGPSSAASGSATSSSGAQAQAAQAPSPVTPATPVTSVSAQGVPNVTAPISAVQLRQLQIINPQLARGALP